MIINCAIIDDEPLAAGLLKSYAEKTPFLNLVGTYGSAVEAMKEIRNNPVHLLFLDIQMPELRYRVCKDTAKGNEDYLHHSLPTVCHRRL